nr:MAG: hypothetical protein DIU81_04885 [[Clostridium] cellulosi]
MKILNIPKRLYIKYLKANLKTKISVYYISILLISIVLISVAYIYISSAIMVKRSSSSAQQTLEAIDQNLLCMVSNVSQFSNYVFVDENVQSALKRSNRKGIDPTIQQEINKSLINTILSSDDISSVLLFDNYNNVYYMSRLKSPEVLTDDVAKASWYETVKNAKGYPVWVMNDDMAIKKSSDDLPVSLVRMVYNTEDYKPLGVLVVNIGKSFGNRIFDNVCSEFKSQFIIVDDSGKPIIQTSEIIPKAVADFISRSQGTSSYEIKKLDGQDVMLSSRKSSCSNWHIIGIMPMSELSKQFKSTGVIILVTLLINIVFLFIGGYYVTNLITKPLTKMKKLIESSDNGNLHKIPVEEVRDDEIVRLKQVYNNMTEQIATLIDKVKEEQKQIRLNELSIIRAQINPHFLYNTLDAVSALALIKDSEGAYTLTQALENFYRISLSSGKDVITVREELKCIENYVKILNIRYKDSFDVNYFVDENIMNEKILKLLLQPFVENSIAHGVHNKRGRGIITIKGRKSNDLMIFSIEDNGVGMSKEKIEEIMSRNTTRQKGGFGIYSSITRISLFYGIENPVSIESAEGKGTRVTITIPVINEEDN